MALSYEQTIYVKLSLRNGPQYKTAMNQAAVTTERFGTATKVAGDEAVRAGKKMTFMQQQAVFMARRGLFYGTLGIVGMGAALVKLGFHYDSVMNTAKVALSGFIKNQSVVNKELRDMYILAAKSPFQFPDIVMGMRRLYAFNGSLSQTNADLKGIINGLSAAGFITASSLNRATLAFAHMYAIGHLNGQVLLQMNRDNLQMTKALMWYYHATGDEIKTSIAGGLISAKDAAKAFNAYMKTPGFEHAAFDQSTKSLQGAWSTFKDLIGLGAGQAEGGMFNKVRLGLKGIDKALLDLNLNKKNLTLSDLATAMDHVISPHTHAFINVFNTLKWTLITVIAELYGLTKAVQWFLQYSGLDYMAQLFHINHAVAIVFGVVLGTLITLFILERSVTIAAALALDVYKFSQLGVAGAIKLVNGLLKIQAILFGTEAGAGLLGRWKSWSMMTKTMSRTPAWKSGSGALETETGYAAAGMLGKLSRAFFATTKSMGIFFKTLLGGAGLKAAWAAMSASMAEAGLATDGLAASFAALWAVIWPIGLIVLIVGGLALLYWKWKWFHDSVNKTAKWIYQNANKIAAALIIAGGPIGLMLAETLLLIKHFESLKKIAVDTAHAITHAWNKVKLGGWTGYLAKSAAGIPAKPPVHVPGVHTPHSLFGVHIPKIPTWAKMIGMGVMGFQEGGTVPGPVGTPRLAVVHGGEQVIPVGGLAGAGGGGGNNQPIIVQLVVDRKVLAQAVARANQDYAARR